jgi:tripartite-type tricarboxylate transporter receptor subunit TctC
MQTQRFVSSTFAGAMMLLTAGTVCGQSYPVKPVRIVTAEAGGGSDSALRMMTPRLAARLGQQVIVDNRGILAADIAAKAPPDGYNLIFIGSTVWVLPLIREKAAYNAVEDFSPITLATTTANILVVHPALPANSVAQLIALAKARPGDLNYGTSGVGSVVHIAAELFKSMAGVDIVRVSYKGATPALNDLIAGQVHLMFGVPGSVMQHVKSGRLRALAVTSAKPSALAPGLPTVAASLPGYESVSYLCFFAPAGTPADIINRLNRDIVAVLNRTDVKEHLLNSGVEPVGNSPEDLAALMKFQIAKMSKLFRIANIRDR